MISVKSQLTLIGLVQYTPLGWDGGGWCIFRMADPSKKPIVAFNPAFQN